MLKIGHVCEKSDEQMKLFMCKNSLSGDATCLYLFYCTRPIRRVVAITATPQDACMHDSRNPDNADLGAVQAAIAGVVLRVSTCCAILRNGSACLFGLVYTHGIAYVSHAQA